MSEPQAGTQEEPKEASPANKQFSRNSVPTAVKVAITLPSLLPDTQPFEFSMRLKLSAEAQESHEQFVALSASDQLLQETNQNLTELCDLLTSMPKGFSDLADNGGGPGESFKDYVKSSTGSARAILDIIIRGANNLYWAKLAPREFRG